MALPTTSQFPTPERESQPNDGQEGAVTDTEVARTHPEMVVEAQGQPLDISRFDTATLVSPAVEADIRYRLWVFVNDHEDEAARLHTRANALGPQLAMWEGTLIALGEEEARLEGVSRPSLRDIALLRRTRAQYTEAKVHADRLHNEIVALRTAAKNHQAAAERIRRTLVAEARQAERVTMRRTAR